MSKPFLKVSNDFTKGFNEAINSLKHKETLVGIPSTDKPRQDGDPINNATILFINEFGSPANNIPPRPVMKIGIAKAQVDIAEEFKACANAVLDKGPAVIDQYYERVGIIASNSVKGVINNQEGIEGPSKATLEAREARGFMGTKALVVSGQLRNSITYIVKGK